MAFPARNRLLSHFLHKVSSPSSSTVAVATCVDTLPCRYVSNKPSGDREERKYDGGRLNRKQFEFSAQSAPRVRDVPNSKQLAASDRPFKHVVVPGKVSPRRPIPENIPRPSYADVPGGHVKSPAFEGPFEIKNAASIQGMRESCALARKILDFAGTLVKPGVTTDEIDAKVHDAIIDSGAYPSTLNYNGFPKSICTSVNDVAAHGIPDDRPLVEGDIISIDITVYYKGFHGDTCDTFFVGDMIDDKARKLVKAGRDCRDAGIAILRPGIPVAAIGAAIQKEAMRHRLGVVQDFVGHGIGRLFHQRPYIFHCKNDYRGILEPGMCFTIEPVIVEKGTEHSVWDDNWTLSMKDGGWAAQFEHTVLITDTGADILTK